MKRLFIDNLIELPTELIELIFKYIPDEYLNTYLDNPLIGIYSLKVLTANIEIDSDENWPVQLEVPKLFIPIGDEGLCLVHKRIFEDVYQFLDFVYRYPHSEPRTIKFCNSKDIMIIHKVKPSILERAHIEVELEVNYEPWELEILSLPYNFYKIDRGDDRDYSLPETVRSLELLKHILIEYPNRLDNLQILRIYWPLDTSLLHHLPPKLASLDLTLFLESDNSKPNLPKSLQRLALNIEFPNDTSECDLSHLDNLKTFESDFYITPLSRIHLPSLITSLKVACNGVGLNSVRQYPNLKSLQVEHISRNIFKEMQFPESLQVLQLDTDYTRYAEIDGQFPIPPNIKLLSITGSYTLSYKCDEISLPRSLDSLTLVGCPAPMCTWTDLQFPPKLLELSILSYIMHELILPASLLSLNLEDCPLQSLTHVNFQELRNLKRLCLNDTSIKTIESYLPPSLKSIHVQGNALNKVIIDVPNLKILDLGG